MIRVTQSRVSVPADLVEQCQSALKKILSSGASNFPELTKRDHVWSEARKVGAGLREKYDYLVLVGIGGSSLGPQVIASLRSGSRLRFLEMVDAAAVERAMYGLDPKRTCFLIVSKSGGTIETLAGTEYLRELLATKNVDLKKQAHVLTESSTNTLGRWSSQFLIPCTLLDPNVGGRYSVLSEVGMIAAVFDGGDEQAFRRGAQRALENLQGVAELMAHVHLSWKREEWITFFWFYEPMGRVLGAWLAQLWGESLGKKTNLQGKPSPRASTPMAGLGPVDQHSLLQQLADGYPDKFIIFVRSLAAEKGGPVLGQSEFADCKVLEGRSLGELLKAEALATEEALHRGGISTLTLSTNGFDDEGLGEFMMHLQMTVAGLGALMEINPFDQPGVELGKRLAREFLAKP